MSISSAYVLCALLTEKIHLLYYFFNKTNNSTMFGNFKTIRIALALMLAMIVSTIQAQTVTGNVKDSFGDPVIGATIMEKGTQNGTVTDIDGNFTLKLQKAGNITVSYVGMKAQTVETKGKSSLSITMEDDNTTLNDVVVVGYGVMKKKDLTGAVASVKQEDLGKVAAANALQAMQAKAVFWITRKLKMEHTAMTITNHHFYQ